MTREEIIKGLYQIKNWECNGNPKMHEVLVSAIKELEQENILDKIYTDIQTLRDCSCYCSDGIIDDVEDIIDKYRESGE